jgi:phosphoesterase RecJ-like protein
MLALFHAYNQKENTVHLFSIDEVPAQMDFLPGVEHINPLHTFNPSKYDLVVAFDCGDFSQTGFPEVGVKRRMLPIAVNIDHHGNEPFGDLNIVDTQVSSTAEMLYTLLVKDEKEITKDVATALLSGIIQDTDNFKNPNTSIETFKITSILLNRGVNLKKIGEKLNFGRSMNSMNAWGKILSRAKKHPTLNVVTTYITRRDMDAFETTPEDIEGIANFLNSMPDVRAACVLMESGDGEIKGSLRTLSDEIDVSKLAQFLGGGGHRRAAGFTLSGSIVRKGDSLTIV